MKFSRRSPSRARRRGFTLAEVMVAVFVSSLLGYAFFLFFNNSVATVFVADHKNRINKDIRSVTSELSYYARMADQFRLYDSFRAADRDQPGDVRGDSGTGDFLLLIYYGPLTGTGINARRPVTQLVGYYRWPENASNPDSSGPVWRFIYEVPESLQSPSKVEDLIPSAIFANNYGYIEPTEEVSDPPGLPEGVSFSRVLELSEGLARNRLFYNLWDSSVMVNGKIIHGNDAKRVTDTYNFTISPRSQVNQT